MPYFMNRFWLRQDAAGDGGSGGGGGSGSGDADKDKDKKNGGGSGDPDTNPFSNVDDAWKEIKKLRGENAGHRNKNKEIDSHNSKINGELAAIKKHLGIKDEEDPKETISQLTTKTESLEFELSIVTLARAHSVPADQDDYFRFLLQKEFAALKEGEEIKDEQVTAVVEKVKAAGGGGAAKKTSTGMGDGGKGKDAGSGGEATTVEQFKKMGIAEKTALYNKDPELYKKLNAASR